MSRDRLEIAVRRVRPDEEEPDRLPLRWSTVARLLAFTGPHRRQRDLLLGLCVFRAMARANADWVGEIFSDLTQDDIETLMTLLAKTKASATRTSAGKAKKTGGAA